MTSLHRPKVEVRAERLDVMETPLQRKRRWGEGAWKSRFGEIRSGDFAAPVVLRHVRMARDALEVLHQQRRDAVHEVFRNVV